MRGGQILAFSAIGLTILLVVVMIAKNGAGAPTAGQLQVSRTVYLLLYALLISGSLWAAFRREGGWRLLRYALIWLAIGGIAVLAYMVMHP